MAEDRIAITIEAVDKFSQAMTQFSRLLKEHEGLANATQRGVSTLTGTMSVFRSVLVGVAQGIGQGLWFTFRDILRDIEGIIPNLISTGQTWIQTIRDLQLETGMTAEEASTLVAVMQHLGMTTESMNVLFARLGRNIVDSEASFTALGVATRDAEGNFLSTYQILTNLRHVISENGASILSTAAAQDLFGRSGYKMLEVLQLSDSEFAALAESARNAGLVLSQETVDAAERMQRTWGGLWEQINGAAVAAFAALEPTLAAFVASFTAWLNANMEAILNFVVSVANFVMGVMGGLLGIDWGAQDAAAGLVGLGEASQVAAGGQQQLAKAAGGAAGGESAVTKAIREQIKAIDEQIKAIGLRRQARQASEEEADLTKAIADAERELADLQNSALNTYGLSGVEKVKAEQKRQADILAAQQKITDAQKKYAEYQADLADQQQIDQLTALKKSLEEQIKLHTAAAGTITAGYKAMNDKVKTLFSDLLKAPFIGSMIQQEDQFKKAAQDALKAGKEFSDWIKKDFIGTLQTWGQVLQDIGKGIEDFANSEQLKAFASSIFGGVAQALEMNTAPALAFIDALGWVGQTLENIINWIRDNIPGADLILGKKPTKRTGEGVSGGGGLSSGGGGWSGGLFEGMFAAGGEIPPNSSAIVGEAGMEYLDWLPGGGVRITPMGEPAGTGGVTEIHTHVHLAGREIAHVVNRVLALDRNIASRRVLPTGVR
jgi:hypothetical protein